MLLLMNVLLLLLYSIMIVESLSLSSLPSLSSISLPSLSTISSSIQSSTINIQTRSITFPAMNSIIEKLSSSISPTSSTSTSFIIENIQNIINNNNDNYNFLMLSLKSLSSTLISKISPYLTDEMKIYLDNNENFGIIAITIISIIMIISSLSSINNNNINNNDNNNKIRTPYKVVGVYNPIESKAYFDERSDLFIKRFIEIAYISTSFGSKYLFDFLTNKLNDPIIETKRATELRELLVRLGPSFIKIGQSLSIRTDLLRPAYIKSLTELQDKVESFPTKEAIDIIQKEFGLPAEELFVKGLSANDKTIAAASLGIIIFNNFYYHYYHYYIITLRTSL